MMIEVIAIALVLLLFISCAYRTWDDYQKEKKKGKLP